MELKTMIRKPDEENKPGTDDSPNKPAGGTPPA